MKEITLIKAESARQLDNESEILENYHEPDCQEDITNAIMEDRDVLSGTKEEILAQLRVKYDSGLPDFCTSLSVKSVNTYKINKYVQLLSVYVKDPMLSFKDSYPSAEELHEVFQEHIGLEIKNEHEHEEFLINHPYICKNPLYYLLT